MIRLLFLTFLLFSPLQAFCQTAYIDTTFAQVPLTFTMNQGQFQPQIKFIAEGNNENLTMDDAPDSSYIYTFIFIDDGYQKQPALEKPALASAVSDSIFIKLYSFMEFYNINQNPEFVPDGPSSWNSNYFIGNNRDDWRMDLPNYAKITHMNLYDGIDLQYSAEKRRIKYEIIVRAGADPSKIRFRLPINIFVNDPITQNGQITYTYAEAHPSTMRKAFFNPPDCFQYIDGKEVKIDLKYKEIERINGKDSQGYNVVYVIAGYDIVEYNPDYDLHIKPKYIDSISYIGKRTIGSITGMDVDDSENVYATGEIDFPINAPDNSTNIYILKLDADSGIPEFVSYIIADIGTVNNPIKSDSLGNVYTAGIVRPHTNFPVTENAYDKINTGSKCFVLKLSTTGNEIEYSTFLGGGDEYVYAFDVDQTGNVFVAGSTKSSGFPTTPDSYDTSYNDYYNGFIAKFNANGSDLIFSTFIKGAHISDIFIDIEENIYLTGNTDYYKFPVTEGSYNYEYNINLPQSYNLDVFVIKLDKEAKSLNFSTRFGGQKSDGGQGIKVSDSQEIFITGTTSSLDFPTTQDGFEKIYNGGYYDMFITKMNSNGSDIVYSSYFGGSEEDSAHGLCFDKIGNILINGNTSSSNFPITPDGYNKNDEGTWDLGTVMNFV